MNKSFKLFAGILFAGIFSLSLSSCKDEENVSNGPTPEEMAQSKESDSAKGLLSVLSFTSQLDSLPDNWYSNNYTVEPIVGTVNDASTPYVRYVPVLNKEEAIAKYNSIADQVISENATSASWNIENVGSLRFSVLDQSDVIATLDVNIKQQPHLSQIRFVPVSAMGENAKLDGEPYYNFGDIVALTEGTGKKSYWICVRPCSQIEKKSTSHWMSFNLNDWDSNSTAKVPSGSVNIKKLTKSGSKDYYLPTQLGNKSESREHLQNLFKLLMILDSPSKYANFPDGLGGIGTGEFTEDMVKTISNYWKEKDYWKTVLPKNMHQVDLTSCFSGDNPEVNVFYYGYHTWLSSASVHRAQLTGTDLHLASDGEIKWTRGVAGVDFRNYANYGLKEADGEMDNIDVLPRKGFVVRYKTGKQLVGGGSGNDEAPTHSFMDKHQNSLEDIYVYRNYIQYADKGASVIADRIYTESGSTETEEECVIQYSKDNPSYLGNNSYYIKLKEVSEDGENVVLQNKDVSTIAYINMLNAAAGYTVKGVLNDTNYGTAVALLDANRKFSSILGLKYLDADGKECLSNEYSKIKKVTIEMPYKDSTLPSGQYRMATLEYDVTEDTYTVKPHNAVYSTTKGKSMYELNAYSDISLSSPVLKEGQRFSRFIIDKRTEYKRACSDFVKNVLSRIK